MYDITGLPMWVDYDEDLSRWKVTVTRPNQVRNLTPHGVKLFLVDPYDEIALFTIDPEPHPARISMDVVETSEYVRFSGGLFTHMKEEKAEEIQNLPAPSEGVYLIVSRPVAMALPERRDLVVPAELIRDDQGNVVGARSLARIS
ncbi:hypothetical protein EF847_01525 [Actinobacteria bacterium YIM 96077]|uniref:Uncharacterized protein n=2 Tax=Phytoactinopolyspora halophila TaxID=1981511 RepID=A0A329QFK5_9ACTN|nr:hypothetical protein EF847_01525 [Actinobacteria bacterium YIM 96077]RAW11147.1 hypothetical protein DPM12_17550 [Phytoactinopolyspora halophila]